MGVGRRQLPVVGQKREARVGTRWHPRVGSVASLVGGSLCFFFQAEDGIRDLTVTGVQTCALPIFRLDRRLTGLAERLDATYTRYADDLVLSGGPALARRGPSVVRLVEQIAAAEDRKSVG